MEQPEEDVRVKIEIDAGDNAGAALTVHLLLDSPSTSETFEQSTPPPISEGSAPIHLSPPEDESYETIFHVLVPDKIDGGLYISGQGASLGNGEHENAVKMHQGLSPNHWMSPPINLQCPGLQFNILMIKKRGILNPLKFLDEQKVTVDSGEPHCARPGRHNFIFPKGKKGGTKEFRMNSSRGHQMAIFLQYLTGAVDSVGSLVDTLEDVLNLVDTIAWKGRLNGAGKPEVEARVLLMSLGNAIPELCDCQETEKSDLRRVFLAVVGCFVLAHHDRTLTHDTQLNTACSMFLSCFNGFQFFVREENPDISSIPPWALNGIWENRCECVAFMVKLSSHVSYEWIQQIPNLLIACRSIGFFGHAWESQTGYRSLPGNTTVPSPGTDQEFISAVEGLVGVSQVEKLLESPQSMDLIRFIISAAPGVRSIFMLASHSVFRRSKSVLCSRLKELFRKHHDSRLDMMKTMRAEWETQQNSVDGKSPGKEGEGVEKVNPIAWGSAKDSSSSSAQESHVLVSAVKAILLDNVGNVGMWSREDQGMYTSFVQDRSVFKRGLLDFANGLQHGRVMHYGAPWPDFFVETFFLNMLPSAVVDSCAQAMNDRDALVGLCDQWFEQRFRMKARHDRSLRVGFVVVEELLHTLEGVEESQGLVDEIRGELLIKCQNKVENEDVVALLKGSHSMASVKNPAVVDAFFSSAKRCLQRNRLRRPTRGVDWSRAKECFDALVPPFAKEIPHSLLQLMNIILDQVSPFDGLERGLGAQTLISVLQALSENGAEFWERVVKVQVEVLAEENIHDCVTRLLAWVDGIVTAVVQGNINVEDAKEVIARSDGLKKFCTSLVRRGNFEKFPVAVNAEHLRNVNGSLIGMERALAETQNEMSTLQDFVEKICRPFRAHNVTEEYLNLLRRRERELPSTCVNQLHSDENECWQKLSEISGIARKMHPFSQSAVFISALQSYSDANQEDPPHTMTDCIRLIDPAFGRYQDLWKPLVEKDEVLLFQAFKLLLACHRGGSIQEEFRLAETHLRKSGPSTHVRDHVRDLEVAKQALEDREVCGRNLAVLLQQTENVWSLVKEGEMHATTASVLHQWDSRESILSEFASDYRKIRLLLENTCPNGWHLRDYLGLLCDLSSGRHMVQFVKEIGNEDIRMLSDSVEDSDSFIREDTVACFIAVKGFVSGLVMLEGIELEGFMENLKQLLARHSTTDNPIAPQLKLVSENIFAIKSLYERVSDRGEFTKVVVKHAMTSSRFAFDTDKSGYPNTQRVLKLRNARGIQKIQYSMADLQDYRSRALLLIDAPGLPDDGEGMDDQKEMQVFIKVVDLSTEIVALLKALADVGHFTMYDWRWTYESNANVDELALELSQLRDDLEQSLEGWKEHLRLSRQRYYVLNFLRSRQITYVWNKVFCEQNGWADVREILSALSPEVMRKEMPSEVEAPVEVPEDKVLQLGEWLEDLADLPPRRRPIPTDFVHASACVESGEVFVGICDRDHAFNVILSMYAASGFFPEPGELLICNESTDWEDIELLLLRCQRSEGTCRDGRLFCLAGVDSLLVEVQTQVAEYIANMSRPCEDQNWKFGILSGSKHCYLVDQFKGAIRPVKAMSDEEVGELFAQQFEKEGPTVVILTSEASGMGKTDRVKEIQSLYNGESITVPIGGPLLHHDLVQETKRHLAGREASNIHLDVSGVNWIAGLDNFLFELIVLNHTSSKESCLLLDVDQDTVISIELANTLCEELRIGMHFCQLAPVVDVTGGGSSSGELPPFSREHLEWDLSRLKVSQDLSSDVQIVCHHLAALENSTFAHADLNLDAVGVQPLDAEQCRTILQTAFCQHVSSPSFSVLMAFLRVFAWQLRSLSLSCFFMVETLQWVGRNPAVRLDLLTSLLEVSRHFTIESSSAAFLSQQQQAALLEVPMEERMAQRVKRLVSWEDNNHLMILFNQGDGHSITAVYRSIRRVPQNVTELILSQHEGNLPDFSKLRHWELCTHLLRIMGLPEMVPFDGCHYVLTPDNFLKMVLLHVRIRADVPVVIMGETGCGKTSLIRYLAGMSQVEFKTLNIHAGTSRKAIRKFIDSVEADCEATGEEVWAFLDEINTCSELGMINDLVCHKQIDGRDLMPGVTILVACNPYRVKDRSLPTAGYELSRRNRRTELVYSVHPLPETMMAYVWDYGELSKEAQRLYLTSMLEDSEARCLEASGLLKATTDVLLLSQEFIRSVETPWSTSLRDFKRWILLFGWFREKLLTSPKSERYDTAMLTEALDYVLYGGGRIRREKEYEKEVKKRSILLSLSICYYMRLGEADLRRAYLEQISAAFEKHRIGISPQHFLHVLQAEQEDYIARMTLPRGIAKNRALLENVFAGIVCILNRLPLFMVGKPGCSKSLSLQLIHSNLRGPDSSEELFRSFPQIIFVSFQGSETSTSDGILKIFQKAKKFLKPDGRTMPVVLLDEIGLAEISPHNPLKVLHSLLEPGYPKDRPDVAVVGISNWALDAAKMNRAIVLSRPDPAVKDLERTADAIKSSIMAGRRMSFSTSDKIKSLASEYHRYISEQPVENFHGLRDFYSLIKSLCERAVTSNEEDLSDREFGVALARSFGGLDPQTTRQIIDNVMENIGGGRCDSVSVKELIKDSIRDKTSRNLMLITKGDFVLDVLKNDILKEKSPVVMYGSTFPEDESDSYTYRVLSKIRLCLGEGRVLVLKNLDKVYGALYDMLNQNYTEVGGRKYCRIALGAHSNPMCHVHPDFRCIVFMDHSELENADPPFLNRFEKQHLDLDFLFNRLMRNILRILEQWVGEISTQADSATGDPGQAFGPKDMFAGLNDITLKSLVLRCNRDLSREARPSEDQLLEACKTMLSKVAFLDGVVRAKWSVKARADISDVREWCAKYFLSRPTSLKDLLSRELELDQGDSSSCSGQNTGERKSSRLVVMTELPVKPQTIESLASVVDVQRYQLHTLTSERSISEVIKSFFTSESRWGPELLMFEASSRQDGRAFQLLRFLVDQQRTKYLAEGNGEDKGEKHVCVVIQMDRGQISQRASKSWQFHFLSGWDQVLVCDPDGEGVSAERLLNDSLLEILTTETLPLREVIGKVLFRCFLCQKYDARLDSVGHIREVVTLMRGDSKLMDCFCLRIEKALEGVNLRRAWQQEVACSRAKVANSGGILRAAELFVEERVKNLVAKLIFVLEKGSNLKSYFHMDSERKEIWRDLLLDDRLVSIDNVADPAGLEHFSVGLQPPLGVPFVHGIIDAIQSQEELYRQEKHDGSTSNVGIKIVERLETTLHPVLKDQFSLHPEIYVSDFVTALAYEHFVASVEVFRSVFMRALHQARVSMEQRGDFTMDCILVHIVWWSQREEISSLVQLMHICPDLLQHLDGLSEGDQVTNSNILRLTLRKIRSDMEAIKNMEDARSWVTESDSVLSKLHALEDRMSHGEREILADHHSVVNFLGAVSGAENEECGCVRIVKELGVHLGFESRMVLRSAGGIHSLHRVLGELLNAVPNPIMVASLNRAMSQFLSSCFESRTSTQGRLDCYEAAWGYVMQEPVPPCSMSVVISMLHGIGADLQGVEYQEEISPSCQFVLALHLLDAMRNGPRDFLGGSLAVMRDAVSQWDVDSHAVALVADGMQVFAMDGFVHAMLNTPRDAGRVETYMSNALRILADPGSHGTFMVVIATAFLRANLESLPGLFGRWMDRGGSSTRKAGFLSGIQRWWNGSKEVGGKKVGALRQGFQHQGDTVKVILKCLSKAFESSQSDCVQALHEHLLKVLRRDGLGIQQIRELSADLRQADILGGPLVWNPLEGNDKVKSHGFNLIPGFEEAQVLIATAIQKPTETQALSAALGSAAQRPDQRRAMIAATVALFYLPRFWRDLDKEEKSFVQQLVGIRLEWPASDRAMLVKFASNDFAGTPLEASQSVDAHHVQSIVLQINLILCVIVGEGVSPLSIAWQVGDRLARAFLPAMPEDERRVAFQAMESREGGARYQCGHCDFMFAIGNCGQPNQSYRCLQCGNMIGGGGSNRRIDHAAPQPARPGYIIPMANESSHGSVRNLTPFGFRLVRLWIHTVMRWGSFFNAHEVRALMKTFNGSTTALQELCDRDWVVLQELLPPGIGQERGFLLLNALVSRFGLMLRENGALRVAVLGASQDRDRWEDRFMQDVVKPICDDVQTSIADYTERIGVGHAHGLEARIDELEDGRPLQKLFRTRQAISMEVFRQQFHGSVEIAGAHPMVAYLLDVLGSSWDGHVLAVSHLWGILQWTRAVHSRLNRKIMREEAVRESVRQFLTKHPDLEDLYRDFEAAWNSSRHVTTRFECTDLEGGIPEMTRQSSIAMSLYEKRNQGLFLAALITHLVHVQNTFLRDFSQIIADTQSASRKYRSQSIEESSICTVGKQRILGINLDQLEALIVRSGFIQWETGYGRGLQLEIDMHGIETSIVEYVLGGACFIDMEEMEEVVFLRETFLRHVTMISDVASKCDQVEMEPDQVAALREEMLTKSEYGLVDFFAALEVIMCVLKRTGCAPKSSIVEFVDAWIDDQRIKRMFSSSGGGGLFGRVLMENIVSWYELVEELLGAGSCDEIRPEYRQSMDESIQTAVLSIFEGGRGTSSNPKLRSSAFRKVLSQFIFRFLSAGEDSVHADVPLALYLCDPRCVVWPSGSVVDADGAGDVEDVVSDLLPGELLVGHCYALLQVLKTNDE